MAHRKNAWIKAGGSRPDTERAPLPRQVRQRKAVRVMANDRTASPAAPLTVAHRFTFQGRQVAWGKTGAGPSLVLVHGTPFSAQVWRRIVPWLAQHWTVHYYDMLGYGQSAKTPDADVSLGIQNDLLAALMAQWDLRTPDVLCHDFGGATVLRAHYLNGLTYRNVTIFDAVALSPWGSPFVGHVRQYETAFAGLPPYAHDALLRAYLQGDAHHELSDTALAIYCAPWQGDAGQPAFYRQIAQMDVAQTQQVEPRFDRFAQRVQVLWGQQDRWIPIETGRRFARMVSDLPLIEVPDCGHLMQEGAPEAIVAAMLSQNS